MTDVPRRQSPDLPMDQYKIFEYIVPANQQLYKGTPSRSFDMKYNKPSWFTESLEIAKGYSKGNYVHSIRNKNPLRLINIMNPHFHLFLIDLINNLHKYDDNNASYHKKMQYLIPLGLPDAKSQVAYIKEFFNEEPKLSNTIQLLSPFFQHKHRFSEKTLDHNLIRLLKGVMWQHKFVGYIAPCKWVSYFHQEFHEEICLFDMSNTDLVYFNYSSVQQPYIGGAEDDANRTDRPYNILKNYDHKQSLIDIYRAFGWYGPVEYDESGDLVEWNSEYVQAKVRKKKFEDETGEPYHEDIEKYRFDYKTSIWGPKKVTTPKYRLKTLQD
jgi:hypothetical protein